MPNVDMTENTIAQNTAVAATAHSERLPRLPPQGAGRVQPVIEVVSRMDWRRPLESGGSQTMLTVKQAALRLGISPATVYQLCAAKLLPHSRVGRGRGVIRIAEADLDRYLAGRRVEGDRPPLRFIR
jgi:excisionase family DNA binding protein